ncbi:PE-PGRS family protein [Streptomyces decoyicus]|uniref:PE-PGRS family protein n=1 Tax=Streptomyces decoyicus TaxID=249567 RepID=UPI00363283DA
MTTGPAARAARAVIFAAVCVTTAALGHALMSHAPLPWWALLAAFCATAAAAWWPAGRERGALVIIGSTVLTQLGLHSLFGLAQTGSDNRTGHGSSAGDWAAQFLCDTSGAAPTPASREAVIRLLHRSGLGPGHTHLPPTHSGEGGGMGHMSAMSGAMDHMPMQQTHHNSIGMLLAHTLAAVLCGLWLWRGEAAAFRLGRSLAASLFAPLLLVLKTLRWTGQTPSAAPVTAPAAVGLRGVLFHHVLSRRGPPGLSLYG